MARWMQGLICGVVLILATPSVVLAGILLLPTLMAGVADRQPGRPVARAVLLYGLAGSCEPLDRLWHVGHGVADALALACDIRVLAFAWAAQACGWLVTQCLPLLIGIVVEAQTQIIMTQLRRRHEALEKEWAPPKGGP